jgi:capsular exopolysaccharide synthesis family protein
MNASHDAKLHLDHWGIISAQIGVAIFIFFLSLVAAGVIAFLPPKDYIASTTIETKADANQLSFLKGSAPEQEHDPNFAEKQTQIIVSHSVLDPVIQHSDLQKKWSLPGVELSPETAYDKLRGLVQPPKVLPPDSIQISVRSTDPQEAALLANAIAQEYVDQRNSWQQASVEEGLQQLRDEVQQDEGSVSTRFAHASRLRTEAGYMDPNPDSTDASLLPEEPVGENSQNKINEIQENVATLKNRLDAVDRIKSADLAQAAGFLNLNDPVLEQKLPLYQNAVTEKTRLLSSGLGHNHPDVRAVQGQIDAIEEQVRQEISNIRKGLVTQLGAAEGTLNTFLLNLVTNPPEQKRKEANAQYLDAKQQYDEARQELDGATTRLNTATTESRQRPKPALVLEAAKVAPAPSQPKTIYVLWGALAGLVLGAGFACLREVLDRSIKTPWEVEKRLGLRLLGVISRGSQRRRQIKSQDPDEEPYATLKPNVDMARQKVAASVLTVVSAGSGEGKSTTAANLAAVYAATGQQTLIIDAALRRPAQHQLFDVGNRVGLSDFLRGEKNLEEIVQEARQNLFIVTSGPASHRAGTLLSSQKLAELVEIAKEWFDVVIFDCPAVLGAKEAAMISSLAEGSIIVARHRRFSRAKIVRAKQTLENQGAKVLGLILNHAYVKLPARKPSLGLAVDKRTEEEFEVSEFEAAANRLPGDEAY